MKKGSSKHFDRTALIAPEIISERGAYTAETRLCRRYSTLELRAD